MRQVHPQGNGFKSVSVTKDAAKHKPVLCTPQGREVFVTLRPLPQAQIQAATVVVTMHQLVPSPPPQKKKKKYGLLRCECLTDLVVEGLCETSGPGLGLAWPFVIME